MSTLLETAATRTAEPALKPRKAGPVRAWAVAGAVILAFQLYVWGSWVLGENFERVPSGPSEPPHWMKVVLNTWQILSIPVLVGILYWFLLRPWLRQRRVTTDGLLSVCFLLVSFQDPLSSYFGHWFTYNSYLFNRGSWVSDVPGWLSFGEPGQMLVEPILFAPMAYVYFMLGLTMLGCGLMRRVRAWRPQAPTSALVGACFALMVTASFVIEGLLWMPLGFYTYAGGIASIFPDTYHKYPIHEGFFLGAAMTGLTCLRYFRNDKGQTLVERGLEHVRAGIGRATAIRFLALLGAVHVIFFIGYNVPSSMIGAHSNPWPEDLVRRSYFTNYICGAETDRACPAPGVPHTRGNSARLGPDGRLVVPEGVELPAVVPFDPGPLGSG